VKCLTRAPCAIRLFNTLRCAKVGALELFPTFGVSPVHGQTPILPLPPPIGRADTLSLDKWKTIG